MNYSLRLGIYYTQHNLHHSTAQISRTLWTFLEWEQYKYSLHQQYKAFDQYHWQVIAPRLIPLPSGSRGQFVLIRGYENRAGTVLPTLSSVTNLSRYIPLNDDELMCFPSHISRYIFILMVIVFTWSLTCLFYNTELHSRIKELITLIG